MKVAVIGGTGVFGSRLVRMLVQDGHKVIVCGRGRAAVAALADEVGAVPLRLDRSGDLAALWALNPDAVVDAAGPFHAYGAVPYALPQAAIARRVHYLDLADDAAFCAGIGQLDAAACAAGVVVLSGVSSVPAISSAAVAMLAAGADEVDTIASAILPGNRAPRGQSVVDSILHQAGTPIAVTCDGVPDMIRSWSDRRRFTLGTGLTRTGYAIRVPDQALFPGAFGAQSVTFHAGLELWLLNAGLAAFSWLRGWGGFAIPRWLGRLVRWLAALTVPFGSDRGGMVVTVIARWGETWRERSWRLIVTQGQGPFIPGVAARAVLRDIATLSPGARPAIAPVPLSAMVAAMEGLAVTTSQTDTTCRGIFAGVLGADMARLSAPVTASHDTVGVRRWTGQAQIGRDAGWYPALLAALFRFPAPADNVPVTVTKTPANGAEVWERRFGRRVFRSILRPVAGRMTEQFGPFRFTLGLHVDDGALYFPVIAGQFCGLPLPGWCLPGSVAREHASDGRFHFDVALRAPLTGQTVVHYRGWLERAVSPEVRHQAREN